MGRVELKVEAALASACDGWLINRRHGRGLSADFSEELNERSPLRFGQRLHKRRHPLEMGGKNLLK